MKSKALLVVSCALLASAAFAAESKPQSVLRLGWATPTNSDVRDATGRNGFFLGFGYLNPTTFLFQGGESSLEFTWTRFGSGDRLDSYSLMYVERSKPESGLYYGLGAGFVYHDLRIMGVGETGFRFAATGLVGYGVAKNTSLELFYNFTGSLAGSSTDRYGLQVTFRF